MFFLSTRDGKDFCEFILGYKMNESVESNILYCGDLPEGREIPADFKKMTTSNEDKTPGTSRKQSSK